MTEDLVIVKIHRHHEEHAAFYGHDLKRVAATLGERGRQFICLPSNPKKHVVPDTRKLTMFHQNEETDHDIS
uniref:Uncharacterized protein n=1 Tax=Candidatus Kentrum sp. UNK TaxID=2126344 RepID=A0A451AGW4_9GAMM|nr:MAG: hypothetical protein BECKUNK1418G_GA0071005_106010 [Candidatus Kentron sp. UNK]VFK71400.1 MAG: hypothetical protein BECKUNK1418H_GA0071006_106410 [Candidatus Kentron sp. UNK]